MTTTSENAAVAFVTQFMPNPMDPPDPAWIEDQLERGQIRSEKIPPLYRNAEVTEPLLLKWVEILVRGAVMRSPMNPKITSGPSVLVNGPVGVGKTHQIYGAMRALNVSGAACGYRFVTAADLYGVMRHKQVDPEQVVSEYENAHVLFLDDLGAAKDSEWREEVTFRILDHRYTHKLPTLITTNVSQKELEERLGERIASRLAGFCKTLTMTGPDRRRESGWDL